MLSGYIIKTIFVKNKYFNIIMSVGLVVLTVIIEAERWIDIQIIV